MIIWQRMSTFIMNMNDIAQGMLKLLKTVISVTQTGHCCLGSSQNDNRTSCYQLEHFTFMYHDSSLPTRTCRQSTIHSTCTKQSQTSIVHILSILLRARPGGLKVPYPYPLAYGNIHLTKEG